jgi:hypothetical protein
MVRALVAAALLVASLGTVGALAWWSHPPAAGDAGAHAVSVVGPDGARLFSGDLAVGGATALSLLQATGLDAELDSYPGMGAYVRGIAGHRATSAAGWMFDVEHEGTWTVGDRSASSYALAPHDGLAWRWSDAPKG